MEARFTPPVQTGCDSLPASYTMGTGSSLGLKRPGRGVDHPPPSGPKVKERVKIYLYSPSGPSWPALGSILLVRVQRQRRAFRKSAACPDWLVGSLLSVALYSEVSVYYSFEIQVEVLRRVK